MNRSTHSQFSVRLGAHVSSTLADEMLTVAENIYWSDSEKVWARQTTEVPENLFHCNNAFGGMSFGLENTESFE